MIKNLFTKIFGQSDTVNDNIPDPDNNGDIFEVYESKQEAVILYTKLKQNFLKQQISTDNQEQFSDLLKIKRTNGTDINNWTYDELVNIVDDFNKKQNLKPDYTSEI